jgi:hypothetical protein
MILSGSPPHSAERLAFPGTRKDISRLRLEKRRHSLQKIFGVSGKANLTALGRGKPQRNSPITIRR